MSRAATSFFIAFVTFAGCATEATEDPVTAGDDLGGGKADDSSTSPAIPSGSENCALADSPSSWELADAPLAARERANAWKRDVFPQLASYSRVYAPKLEKIISMESADRMVLQITDAKPPGYYQGQGNWWSTRSWVVFVDGTSFRTIEERRFAYPIGTSYMLLAPKTEGGTGDYDTAYTLVDKDGEVLAEQFWNQAAQTRVAEDAVVIKANTVLTRTHPNMYVARPEGIYLLHDPHYLRSVAPVCQGFEGAWATP